MARRMGTGMVLGIAGLLLGVSIAARAEAPALTPPAAMETGKRLSLDLKGVDILDVLKLLSQRSGLNFVAGRNVTGRVTIFVNDVDVWEAFERIVDANELAYERRGDIVTVMAARDYELLFGEKFQERKERVVASLKYGKAVQVATALNQLKSAVGQVVVDEASNTLILNDVPVRLKEMQGLLIELDRPTHNRIYRLDYADAEQLKEKVQELLTPIGTVTVDKRTNTAVITDLDEVLVKIDRLVRAFDTPDGEVLIEAKIIKVTLTDEMDLGVDWARVFAGADAAAAGSFDTVSGDVVAGTASGLGVKLLTPGSSTKLVIEALKSVTKTDTLSSPRIMVSNNQEAKILVGKREAFVTTTTTVPATGSTVTAQEIEFVDVGTKLYVTPQIKRDGFVQLKVRPEVSSAEVKEFKDNRIPIVTSTEAETTVLVKSGSTVIIGGLIEGTTALTNKRLPLLGDLPFVGLPFRGTIDKRDKTELVVFLTPQIVLPDGSHDVTIAEPGPIAQTGDEKAVVALREPVSDAYRQRLRRRLERHLAEQFRFASLGDGSVVISFVLSHDGQLVGEPMITSPQGQTFVKAAQDALQQAQPFPSFPDGSPATEVRFKMGAEYRQSQEPSNTP